MKWGYRIMIEKETGWMSVSNDIFPLAENYKEGIQNVKGEKVPGVLERLFVFSDKNIAEFNLKYERLAAAYSRMSKDELKKHVKFQRNRLQRYIKKFRALTGMTLITRNEWRGVPTPRYVARCCAAVDVLEKHGEDLRKKMAGIGYPIQNTTKSKFAKLVESEE